MTRLLRSRILRIAGLALGAVAIGVAAIAVTASASGMTLGIHNASSTPSPTPTKPHSAATSTACSDFMKNFANEIHKSQAEINSAFQKAIADTLAGEVKSGEITQAQADKIKRQLANQTPCNLPSHHKTGGDKTGGDKNALGAYMQQYLAAAASALGISQTQLTTDLKSGQSLSQVASAQNVTEAQFRAKLIANLTPALDTAVANKALTAAQEQEIISRLQTGPLPLWTQHEMKPKPTTTAPSPSPKA